jgi:hypothetical protein
MTAAQHTPRQSKTTTTTGLARRRLPLRATQRARPGCRTHGPREAADVAAQRPHRQPHSSNNEPLSGRQTRSRRARRDRPATPRRGTPECRVNARLDARYPDFRDGRGPRAEGRLTGQLLLRGDPAAIERLGVQQDPSCSSRAEVLRAAHLSVLLSAELAHVAARALPRCGGADRSVALAAQTRARGSLPSLAGDAGLAPRRIWSQRCLVLRRLQGWAGRVRTRVLHRQPRRAWPRCNKAREGRPVTSRGLSLHA